MDHETGSRRLEEMGVADHGHGSIVLYEHEPYPNPRISARLSHT